MSSKFFVSCWVCLFAMACTGDGGVDLSNRDPRCVTACTAEEPFYEDIGKVCNAPSREQCLDECETRIANLATVCQNCLVEEACFGPDGCDGEGPGGFCDTTTCTITTELGTCMYSTGNEAARLECLRKVDPRREVTCTSEFRPTTECASVCS